MPEIFEIIEEDEVDGPNYKPIARPIKIKIIKKSKKSNKKVVIKKNEIPQEIEDILAE